jgi:hypothetical protein
VVIGRSSQDRAGERGFPYLQVCDPDGMAPRRPPELGMSVTVRHLDAEVGAVITALAQEGREVTVHTDEGVDMIFTLRAATGAFHAPGQGPRLLLRPPSM